MLHKFILSCKLLCLAVVMCILMPVIACADVPIDEAHFPDPAFRSFLHNGYVGYSSGEIFPIHENLSDYELALERLPDDWMAWYYKGIILTPWPRIESFKGVEVFWNLRSLDCFGNKIKELDVSQNTRLEYLNCNQNSLTTLDVSNNTALLELQCAANNLTSLKLSPSLSTLDCSDNNLSELTLEGLLNLETLDCSNNNLSQLDLSHTTKLKSLRCGTNHLRELDLSNQINLSHGVCYLSMQELEEPVNYQKVEGTYELYRVEMGEYVSDVSRISRVWCDCKKTDGTKEGIFASYDPDTGIAEFNFASVISVDNFTYEYDTHLPEAKAYMYVLVNESEQIIPEEEKSTPKINLEALERGDFEDDNIISGMTPSRYIDYQGQELTESTIALYDPSTYGKNGIAADGNSRLILRVQTDRPGYAAFSINDDTGAALETLHREKLSSTSQVRTSQVSIPENEEYHHQISVVLVAPETFPQSRLKNFPSDKFTVHVKFYPDDGEPEEKDLELDIEAAPVLLVPGFGLFSAKNVFGDIGSNGVWGKLRNSGFNVDAWDHGGLRGPSEIFSRNYSGMFTSLIKMFKSYYERGIVCTRADIVAHGMGGLLARCFCVPESRPEDGNYYSPCSYRQGMVRRIITIATPHRGTTWANYLRDDTSKLNTNVEPGIVWTLHKAFIGWGRLGRYVFLGVSGLANLLSGSGKGSSYSAIKDMSVGSEITDSYFPVNVPMHSIYGKTKAALEMWLDVINELISVHQLFKSKSVVNNFNFLMRTYENAKLIPIGGGLIFPRNVVEQAADLARQEYARILEITKVTHTISILEIGAQANKWIMAILHMFEGIFAASNPVSGTAFVIKMINQTLQETLMFGEENDFVVTVSSAQGDFSGYSSEMMDMLFFLKYCHFGIAKSDKAGDRVAELLKGSKSEFKVFDSLTRPAVNSSAYQIKASSITTSDDEPQELSFSDIYDLCFTLNVEPDVITVSPNETASVKFTAFTDKPTGEDFAYIFINNGAADSIIPIISKDENTYEVNIGFTSADFGVMKAYCFSRSSWDNKLYISNVVQLTVNTELEGISFDELLFANSSGTVFLNASEDIGVNLYARTSEGSFMDISSPLLGTKWSIDDPAIVRVNDDGTITGLKEGSTTLRADFSRISAEIDVEVGPAYEVLEPVPVVSYDPVPVPVMSDDPVPVPMVSDDSVPVPKTASTSSGGGGCNLGGSIRLIVSIILVKVILRRKN